MSANPTHHIGLRYQNQRPLFSHKIFNSHSNHPMKYFHIHSLLLLTFFPILINITFLSPSLFSYISFLLWSLVRPTIFIKANENHKERHEVKSRLHLGKNDVLYGDRDITCCTLRYHHCGYV